MMPIKRANIPSVSKPPILPFSSSDGIVCTFSSLFLCLVRAKDCEPTDT